MSETARLRDLGIRIGYMPPGQNNTITDVPGLLVGMTTLIGDSPKTVRTGVTAIFPRPDIHRDSVVAGFHSFNGIGEMTGLSFIEETGMLSSPILLTCTHQLGAAYDAVVRYGTRKYGGFTFTLPVVAETYDGWLNDSASFPLKEEHFVAALESAKTGPVQEGGVGGGTGMIAYEFKAGNGTASRQVQIHDQLYTVGVFVQANHGDRQHLLIDGVKVGQAIGDTIVPLPWPSSPSTSSILIIIATDAPLLPRQCRRLAERATVGLAKTGGYGLDGSGDLFLAFSTGNHLRRDEIGFNHYQSVPFFQMDPLIIAASEAVEEAILNSLVAAETMIGMKGHTAYAIPHEVLLQVMQG